VFIHGGYWRALDKSDFSFVAPSFNAAGAMVPLGGLVDVRQSFGPDPVVRFNGYPAADISGGADPALMSSAEALETAARIATAPSSGAAKSLRCPWSPPIGVRATATTTTFGRHCGLGCLF
jgi:hypothetical protein